MYKYNKIDAQIISAFKELKDKYKIYQLNFGIAEENIFNRNDNNSDDEF